MEAAMHDREEMQPGRSGTFCKGASLVALEAFLMSQQLLKFRMQQLRSQRGSKSAVNLQKKTLQLEVQSLLGWHCGLPPPLHSESGWYKFCKFYNVKMFFCQICMSACTINKFFAANFIWIKDFQWQKCFSARFSWRLAPSTNSLLQFLHEKMIFCTFETKKCFSAKFAWVLAPSINSLL